MFSCEWEDEVEVCDDADEEGEDDDDRVVENESDEVVVVIFVSLELVVMKE